jgi:hypothetical protein
MVFKSLDIAGSIASTQESFLQIVQSSRSKHLTQDEPRSFVVKAEPRARKANKTSTTKLPSSIKCSNLPVAANGADSLTSIKKRSAFQPASEEAQAGKKKQKVAMKPKQVPHPLIPPGSCLVRSLRSITCSECDQKPCANLEWIFQIHADLKKSHCKVSNCEGVAGDNKQHKHFNDGHKKRNGGEEPGDKCGRQLARKWFPCEVRGSWLLMLRVVTVDQVK